MNRPVCFSTLRCCLLMSVTLAHLAVAAEPREHLLFQAIGRGDVTLVRDTLRRGADPNVRADDGTTPLMAAAQLGSPVMVRLLLDRGADARAANQRQVTALLWGARDAEIVQLLLDRNADPNAASKLGNTPLMAAAASPAGAGSVRLLLDRGADITLRNSNGRSALRMAAEGGDVQTVRLLLARARELDQLDKVVSQSGSAVADAARYGHHEIVNLLLEHGADANRRYGSRGHALNAALLAGHTDIARTLVKQGAALDRQADPGDVPTAVLAAYTETDDCALVDVLRKQGVDFAAASSSRQTALTWARLRGHPQLIAALQKAGAAEGELPARPDKPSRDIELSPQEQPRLIVQAVEKSVDLLQLSSDTFLDVRRNCVSCHHQNLPAVALSWARDRGFQVRQATIDHLIERQVESWQPRIDRAYQLDSPFPVPPRFLGYGMWSFGEWGYQPDELTRAVSWYLAATQQPDGRWVPGMLRPPMGGDQVLATMLAVRALQLYPLAGRPEEQAERIKRARQWLEQAETRTHQQRVCRMLGLAWCGVEPAELSEDVQQLLQEQRDDGGWAQLPGLQSDAWATGQTLVALRIAGDVSSDEPAFQRGVQWLLKSQYDDGSWFVQTRSFAFQPYFESKFPYGRDQWISAPATAWAVMALAQAVERSDVERFGFAGNSEPGERSEPQTRPATPPSAAQLPAAAKRQVDFAKDIQPLLARSCIGCHAEKDAQSNFSMTSRASLLRGGDSELPAVVPGVSQESPLVRFAAGLAPELEMPPLDARQKNPPLTQDEIALLRAWIDQGAKWAAGER